MERTKSSDKSSGNQRQPEEFYEDDSFAARDLAFQREGLPADYRMRHDEHYIDELVASGRMPQIRLVSIDEIDGEITVASNNLDGLTDSIREFGVLQPLLVRRDRGRYELLASSKRLAAAISAGLTEVPCLLHEVDEMEARRLAEAASRQAQRSVPTERTNLPLASAASALVQGSLQTVLSTLGLLDKPEATLRDQVAVGLIRTECLAATRLLQGLRLLNMDPPLARKNIDVGSLVREVLTLSEDERGLLAIDVEEFIEECVIRADEQLVTLALSGAVQSMLALLRASRGAKLKVRLSRNELTKGATLLVTEDAVRMPTASWSRWFDLEWEKRPGGFAAAVALLAAKRATELHGGHLDITPTEAGGCELAVILPSG